MFITVAICTLNRGESLRRTLASLVAMRRSDDLDWEIVVVNNNCTDHTDAVIGAFLDQLPIRREYEEQRGLSCARNRAIDAADGDYIVWTDDDVEVDAGWLAAYTEAFSRWPEATVFSGKIVETYATPVPDWIVGNSSFSGFAARDFGDEPLPLSIPERRLPFGANFAVRSIEQRTFRYNPDLGPGSTTGLLGDEVDVIERILRTGATGRWVPASKVTHYIGHERQTIDYIVCFYATIGESEAFRFPDSVNDLHIWFGAPRWLWRRLFEEWSRYRIHRLVSPASVWLPHLQSSALIWGKIRHWRKNRR
jgi:glycosyltransferase involved in cell wall biosynthesis